jgi:alpha-1,3-rhamnosyl/mannosyltransferase
LERPKSGGNNFAARPGATEEQRMIIGFDGTIFNTAKTGIGYYTYFLIQYLQFEQADLEIRVYDGLRMRSPASKWPSESAEMTSLPSKTIERLRRVALARAAWRAFKSAGFRRAAQKLDLFHATNYFTPAKTDIPTLPLIHDLSHIRHPEWHPAERVRWMEARMEAFSRAPLIQTVSHFSAREVETLLGVPRSRIHVTYPGINPSYRAPARDEWATLAAMDLVPGRFFLCVGALEPRKNVATAIRAYEDLPELVQEKFPLVIVGPPGWGDLDLPKAIERLERQGRVRFLGYLGEHLMRALYQECAAFLYPSSYEGFGMPVTEAMATGTRPLVSSDTAPHEICGDVGINLPPFEKTAWRNAMLQAIEEGWWGDSLLRSRLRKRTEIFDWRANARATLDLYRRLLASGDLNGGR